MPAEDEDLWQALLRSGQDLATEADYEHGYKREVRQDLARYVTFRLGRETYGLPIQDIVEISKLFPTTPVPRTAAFLLGIGNVRGSVMPVIDLATRLNLVRSGLSRATRVLIVKHRDDVYGLVVDEVLEVVPIPPEHLEDAPGGIGSTRAEFIRALGRNEGHIVIIVNLDAVLDARHFVVERYRRGATS
jgi:purine-binding chemotaxis protein CheW